MMDDPLVKLLKVIVAENEAEGIIESKWCDYHQKLEIMSVRITHCQQCGGDNH